MKIVFLLNNAYGVGGTIRSVANLSAALAERHDVRIASLYRSRTTPSLAFAPGVRIIPLIDLRPDAADAAGQGPEPAEPSTVFADLPMNYGRVAPSGLSDRRMGDFLAKVDADVVISTRPVLNVYLARLGQPRYLRIAQEHLTHDARSRRARAVQLAAARELDALVCVSKTDAERYAEALRGSPVRVVNVPNCSPAPAVPPAAGDSRIIVAAGRLAPVKRYDRLIDAFAELAPEFPDWQLRIYGRGAERDALRRRIGELGLHNRARLMGAASPIETEWVKGAVAAVSSDAESFGLTLVEAMRCGLPVVATDCPHGPGEIITHGESGLLSPLSGGSAALASALRPLLADEALRRRLAARGRASAAAYAPGVIAARYEELFHAWAPGASKAGPGEAVGRLGRLRRLWRPTAGRPGGRPRGLAESTADGGLRVSLDGHSLPRGVGTLLLRLRHDPAGRELALPLPRVRGSRRVELTLDRETLELAEGRWDFLVAAGPPGAAGRARRVAAEQVRQAALVHAPPRVDGRGVSAWIPYRTKDGNLTVRAWLRPAHAEVDEVLLGDDAFVVRVTPVGPERGPGGAGWRAVGENGGSRVDLGCSVEGDRLALTIPFETAAAAPPGDWRLVLHAPDGTATPASRIGGDVADRRATDVFPPRSHAGAALRLRFTLDHDLVLTVGA
ncbi:Glycosyltransferase involved in cell wall bisynthesis [Streptomyces zhaozhouensis]|uniref:D-inositol 3-phosphate glycosyltransferase n=1 Tax=Streptomyces zhaozhouensis TaxID=1300267 RepID=A0A286DYS6_9ACTN|nr:glycosyltransferase [Streptomyces zhaozhouensis]SOD63704.1 Glycosyltransferase involved in cell wall bisynthesis [Streptomyces zhaozhouensis]